MTDVDITAAAVADARQHTPGLDDDTYCGHCGSAWPCSKGALAEALNAADIAHAGVAADLADERRRHTGSRETVTRLHGLLVEAERRRDEALAELRAADDDRDHARQTAIALWQENTILTKAVAGDEVTLRRVAEAVDKRPAPDPWAQVAQLRAAVEAYADGAPTLEVRAGIAAILTAVFPPDGQPDQGECEHIADRGIGEPGRCWTCGAWMVDVVPTGWALTDAELDAAIVAASGRAGVTEVGEEARQQARALFDRMAEAMVQLGARRPTVDPRVVEVMRQGLQRIRDRVDGTPEERQANHNLGYPCDHCGAAGIAAYVLDAVAELEAGQ